MTISKWSRRKFLEAGVASAITVTGARATKFISVPESGTQASNETAQDSLEKRYRQLLHASMDEIIPAGESMPAASEARCMDYLDRLARENHQVAKELRVSLDALEEVSQRYFGASFLSISIDFRTKALAALEQQALSSLQDLRNYVYEAYYLNPRIRHLIGYEPHPTNGPGPMMQEFDESVLSEVRKKPRHYREV